MIVTNNFSMGDPCLSAEGFLFLWHRRGGSVRTSAYLVGLVLCVCISKRDVSKIALFLIGIVIHMNCSEGRIARELAGRKPM